jgi:tetratricopeptide (TPR) repeat protein
VTYPQTFVSEIVNRCVPVQVDNSKPENEPLLEKYHHIWTPDIRILNGDGDVLQEWQGYLPPAEFAARALASLGQAHLRLRNFDAAEACYVETLTRFPTAVAAPEALYYLGVVRYRRDPESNELLHQWAMLRARYPESEFRIKQSFKELP